MTATTVAGLCEGVGGLTLALQEAAGAESIWHAEVDDDAVTVLEKRFSGVPNVGSIVGADWSAIERPDILTAGFPCQPISAAGRQMADDDPRYLWPAVGVAIDVLRPPVVFLENVQNIVSIRKGAILAAILGDLRALGYAVRWCVLGACAVGLSHHRHRWFCRAVYVGDGAPEAVRVPTKCGAPPRRSKLLPTPVARDGDGRGEGSAEYWAARQAEGRTNGIPLGAVVNLLPTPRANERHARESSPEAAARMAAKRRNLQDVAVLLPTPRARDWKGGETVEARAGRIERGTAHAGYDLPTAVKLLPTPRATDGANGGPNQRGSKGDLALPAAVIGERFAEYAAAVMRQVDATGVLPPEPTEPNKNGAARLAPAFPEWMMTFPRGHVTDVLDRVPALRCIGNGAGPRQAAVAWHLLRAETYEAARECAAGKAAGR